MVSLRYVTSCKQRAHDLTIPTTGRAMEVITIIRAACATRDRVASEREEGAGGNETGKTRRWETFRVSTAARERRFVASRAR